MSGRRLKKLHRAPIYSAFNLQGRLKSWNMFDLVLFGLPARFSLCFIFCSWGLCGQRESHNRGRAHTFCHFAERQDDARWELNHFLSTARSKSNQRRWQLPSLILVLLPWDWQCGKVTCARGWRIRAEFLKTVFFLQSGPTGHPHCSAFACVPHQLPRETESVTQHALGALLCPWLQIAHQMQGEGGGGSTQPVPHTHKSFMLSQQLAAVTQNRSSKWDSSPPGFLLTYSPRTCPSSSSLPGHTMTLRSHVCGSQSQVFLVWGRVKVTNWPFPSPTTVSDV